MITRTSSSASAAVNALPSSTSIPRFWALRAPGRFSVIRMIRPSSNLSTSRYWYSLVILAPHRFSPGFADQLRAQQGGNLLADHPDVADGLFHRHAGQRAPEVDRVDRGPGGELVREVDHLGGRPQDEVVLRGEPTGPARPDRLHVDRLERRQALVAHPTVHPVRVHLVR